MDCSPPGSSVRGIFQARILEWVPFHSWGDLSDTAIKLASPALPGRFFTIEPLHLPGFSVHGILQARILERVAMPSSRGSSRSRNRTHISGVSCIAGRVFTHWATWEAHELWTVCQFYVSAVPTRLLTGGTNPAQQISCFICRAHKCYSINATGFESFLIFMLM